MLSRLYLRFRQAPLSFPEFVMMMAASMSVYALAIDSMLPALGAIGHDFGVTNANQLQWIIMLFMIGGGIGQILYGPLSDWLGRRPVLLLGMALYIIFAILAATATNLPMLLVLRVCQGLAAASANVVPRSIVRDRYAGEKMAKVMSMTFIAFLIVPILAPTVGQALLLVMKWPGIFGFLAMFATLLSVWIILRLPETRHEEYRRSPSFGHLYSAATVVMREPSSLYYTLAITMMFGALMSYISTVPQIFSDAFQRPSLMPTIFALCAGTMAISSFTNVRIVEKLGMRKVSHSALCAFILVTLLHSVVCVAGFETIVSFTILQALTMASFGLAASNFNAIAMQKMGAIAGSAASLQGIVSTIGGALVGSLIGHQWQGNVSFLAEGALCCGLAAMIFILIAERGRLFRNPPPELITA